VGKTAQWFATPSDSPYSTTKASAAMAAILLQHDHDLQEAAKQPGRRAIQAALGRSWQASRSCAGCEYLGTQPSSSAMTAIVSTACRRLMFGRKSREVRCPPVRSRWCRKLSWRKCFQFMRH
jgi:hypothetical protein